MHHNTSLKPKGQSWLENFCFGLDDNQYNSCNTMLHNASIQCDSKLSSIFIVKRGKKCQNILCSEVFLSFFLKKTKIKAGICLNKAFWDCLLFLQGRADVSPGRWSGACWSLCLPAAWSPKVQVQTGLLCNCSFWREFKVKSFFSDQ